MESNVRKVFQTFFFFQNFDLVQRKYYRDLCLKVFTYT